MLKKILLPTIFMVLGYGFWISPDFKEIAAGVAIFLFGMLSLEEGFKAFTGGVLEKILRNTTDKLWKSLSFGIVTTTLMQSSSLVSVITISFLSAGLIGLAQGIGIIFGANLGTTTGAWIISGFGIKVDIAAYAMPMLVFAIILVFQKSKNLNGVGYVLAGLGFLFLGIAYMKTGFEALGQNINLADYAMPGFTGLLVYTGIGILATVVMQSSHATLVLTIAALAAGQVTYENALALAIGSNVGTTITAILGALTANVAGKRLAGAHLLFNVVTGAIAIVLIQQLVVAVDWTSGLLGIAADDYTLKLAVFHTIFNLIGIAVMLPFINALVAFLEKTFVEKEEIAGISQPLFVNEIVLETPDTALEAMTKETAHLAKNVFQVLSRAMGLRTEDILSDKNIAEVVEQSNESLDVDVADLYVKRVRPIYSEMIEFSSKAMATMRPKQAEKLYHLQMAARNLVGAVKLMKEIQPNMARFVPSDNDYMRHAYNEARIYLAKFLRKVEKIVHKDIRDRKRIRTMLKKLKVTMKTDDILANGRLDKLIREGLIDRDMASSLMNDNTYVIELLDRVIEATEVVFAQIISKEKDLSIMDAELELTMEQSKAEIDMLVKKRTKDIDDIRLKERPAAG
ncbi:MAG: Na/Pi symporter [Gammaproteobacteria bacterium]|nr:Na/Pi symporter [Gammaproteobacteria bacterium]